MSVRTSRARKFWLVGSVIVSTVVTGHAADLSIERTAKALSVGSGVPEATAITDLVTKSSANSILSGIVSFEYKVPTVSPLPSDVEAAFLDLSGKLSEKGFLLRAVELDPRFQANAKKASMQINLDDLAIKSSVQGLSLPSIVPRDPKLATATADIFANLGMKTYRDENTIVATDDQDASNGRIFAGTPIKEEADPFRDSVALVGHNSICSGVLVSSDTVLTAAHCFCDGVDDEAIIGASVISPTVRVKVNKIKSEAFRACDKLGADLSIGDVAVLKLDSPVNVVPKDITGVAQIRGEASVRAVGFGRTEKSIGFKYQVNVVIASYQCDGAAFSNLPDKQVYRCQPSYELVAAGLNRDTCSGDSGGPIYIFGDDLKPYLAGITSRAINPNGHCGDGGIYVLLGAPPIRSWLISKGVRFAS